MPSDGPPSRQMGPNAIRWASKRSDGPRGPPSRQTGLEAIRRASRASEGLRGPTRVCKSDPECECRREGREGPRGQPRGRGWAFHAAGPCGCESELEAALTALPQKRQKPQIPRDLGPVRAGGATSCRTRSGSASGRCCTPPCRPRTRPLRRGPRRSWRPSRPRPASARPVRRRTLRTLP